MARTSRSFAPTRSWHGAATPSGKPTPPSGTYVRLHARISVAVLPQAHAAQPVFRLTHLHARGFTLPEQAAHTHRDKQNPEKSGNRADMKALEDPCRPVGHRDAAIGQRQRGRQRYPRAVPDLLHVLPAHERE